LSTITASATRYRLLQSSAAAGQIVLSERLFARLSERAVGASSKNVALKGKREAEPVRVIEFGAGTIGGHV